MPENCTLYCKNGNLAEINEVVEFNFDTDAIEANEEAPQLTVTVEAGNLRISAMTQASNNEQFSKLMLSSIHQFQSWDGEETSKEYVVEHLQESKIILGVVITPGFAADARFWRCVKELSIDLDGLILAGVTVFDVFGTEYLTKRD